MLFNTETNAPEVLTADNTATTQKWQLIVFNDSPGRERPALSDMALKRFDQLRDDALSRELALLRTVTEIGRNRACSSPVQCFGFALIEKRFEQWVEIWGRDGLEDPLFNSHKHVMDKVKEHLEMTGILRRGELEEIEIEAQKAEIYIIQPPDGYQQPSVTISA